MHGEYIKFKEWPSVLYCVAACMETGTERLALCPNSVGPHTHSISTPVMHIRGSDLGIMVTQKPWLVCFCWSK